MLHYILAQVSIQLIFKTGNVFPLLPCFVASTLGSLNNSLVSAPIFSLLRWLVLNPVFPLGGVGYFFYVFPEICHSFLFVFHRQFFAFGACLPFPGASPDGSSLRLEHPHAWGHSSHSQLPIISFRAVGLETVETPQRTITVIF